MIDLAPLRPGRGFRVSKFVGYYSLRFLPFIAARRWVAWIARAWVTGKVGRMSSAGAEVCISSTTVRTLNVLRTDGIATAAPLESDKVADILDHLADKSLVDSDGSEFALDRVPDGVHLASYPLATILHCPHVLEIMNSSQALWVAEQYLGCRPTISAVRMDWSFPGGQVPEEVQRFHRDHDDWSFVKLFVYLTDVDLDSGPHVYVRASHRTSERLSARQYTDDEVVARFIHGGLVTPLGRRGTTFFEDTWGIHKGSVPSTHPRLMFQVQYSILPIFKYDYRPVTHDSASEFDPYVNRLMVRAAEI